MSKHPLYNETGLLKNNKPHVLYALANKQMELKELQREYEARIAQIKLDLTAVEITICLFDENGRDTINRLNGVKKRASSPRLFKNGELTALVIKCIKESDTPITNKEIALKIRTIKGIETDIWVKVKDCTKNLSNRGIIVNTDKYARECVYAIA
jgi:hypothetical protein